MAKLVWRSLLGLLTVFAVVMGEMRVRCDEWGSRNIAQSPSMLPPGDTAGKSKIFDHPKVSMADEIRKTNRGDGRGGGGDRGKSGEWVSGNIAPSPTMLRQGDIAKKSEIFNHPKVNMVDGKRWINGGDGGGGGGWGWGGGGGGGGGESGEGGGGGGGMGGAGGWGWGGGGGGWWAWGCRKQNNNKERRHHHHNWHNGKNGEYKLGEFAQCMGNGRCKGMRLNCPLHCGGPCLYDCTYMCKAHCRRK